MEKLGLPPPIEEVRRQGMGAVEDRWSFQAAHESYDSDDARSEDAEYSEVDLPPQSSRQLEGHPLHRALLWSEAERWGKSTAAVAPQALVAAPRPHHITWRGQPGQLAHNGDMLSVYNDIDASRGYYRQADSQALTFRNGFLEADARKHSQRHGIVQGGRTFVEAQTRSSMVHIGPLEA